MFSSDRLPFGNIWKTSTSYMNPEHDKLLAEIRCNTSNYVFKLIIKKKKKFFPKEHNVFVIP